MRTEVAPAVEQDQPGALAHLSDVLELAELEKPAWPGMQRELRSSGALLNDGDDDDDGNDDEPTGGDDNPDDKPDPDADADAESFTDFDLDSLEGDARVAAEAAQKRMQADYTRKTQGLAEKQREMGQYQAIVEGLEDPERAPEILRILGVQAPKQAGGDDWFLDEEDELQDPAKRIDDFERQLAERDREAAVREIEDREDQQIAEEIEKFEEANSTEQEQFRFSKEEIAFIYLYADELRDEQDQPQAKAAIDLLEEIASQRQQKWIDSKRVTVRKMPKGKPASRKVDPQTETPEERITRMAEAAEAARGAAE